MLIRFDTIEVKHEGQGHRSTQGHRSKKLLKW